jgi:hypothetical protein
MKKIFALMLALVCFFTMTGFSARTTSAFRLYSRAVESINNVDSMIMYTSMLAHMTTEGMPMTMFMEGIIVQVMKSPTEIEMMAELQTMVLEAGYEDHMVMFFRDNTAYFISGGMQFKMPMSMDEALEQAGGNAVVGFPIEAIKSANTRAVVGGREVTIVVDGAAMTDILNEELNLIDFGELAEFDYEMTYGDITFVAIIAPDGNFKHYNMVFSLEMVVDGELTITQYDIYIEFLQLGGVEDIEFPDDLDSFMDLDELMEWQMQMILEMMEAEMEEMNSMMEALEAVEADTEADADDENGEED